MSPGPERQLRATFGQLAALAWLKPPWAAKQVILAASANRQALLQSWSAMNAMEKSTCKSTQYTQHALACSFPHYPYANRGRVGHGLLKLGVEESNEYYN